MAIAKTLTRYLDQRCIDYYTVDHNHSHTTRTSARISHLPAHQMAKAVVLRDHAGFVISVIPGNRTVEVDWVNEVLLGRKLKVAKEDELRELFQEHLALDPTFRERPGGIQQAFDSIAHP